MPRTKQRTPELRRRIADAAVDVLVEDGAPGFTTRKVADRASTSVPALYELFGDKAGLVRELYFEGFRRLRSDYEQLDATHDAVADIVAALMTFRSFAVANPMLFELMFNRPIEAFQPDAAARRTGTATRSFLVDRVQRAIDDNALDGDATDIAHTLLGLAIGLATQEAGGWLGASNAVRQRRWLMGAEALLAGLSPE